MHRRPVGGELHGPPGDGGRVEALAGHERHLGPGRRVDGVLPRRQLRGPGSLGVQHDRVGHGGREVADAVGVLGPDRLGAVARGGAPAGRGGVRSEGRPGYAVVAEAHLRDAGAVGARVGGVEGETDTRSRSRRRRRRSRPCRWEPSCRCSRSRWTSLSGSRRCRRRPRWRWRAATCRWRPGRRRPRAAEPGPARGGRWAGRHLPRSGPHRAGLRVPHRRRSRRRGLPGGCMWWGRRPASGQQPGRWDRREWRAARRGTRGPGR